MSDSASDALYLHSVRAYEIMEQEGRRDVDGRIVWEGTITNLVMHKMGLSNPYCTHIFGTNGSLRRMGSIRQLRRGGGTAGSLWELVSYPTEDAYKVFIGAKKRRGSARMDALEQQVRDLSRQNKELQDLVSSLGA